MENKKNQRPICKAITTENKSCSVKDRPDRERMFNIMKGLSKIEAKMAMRGEQSVLLPLQIKYCTRLVNIF